LDGDGCDEAAFGAQSDDLGGLNNRGIVRILWGWGGLGCPSEAQITPMGTPQPNARVGAALDGGLDVDGDGLPDLAVGAWDWEEQVLVDTGGAWVVPGSWIATLPRWPADSEPGDVQPLVPADGTNWHVAGDADEEEFGIAVVLVPELSPGGRAGLAVGSWHGSISGEFDSGGVRLHRFVDGGLEKAPYAILGGESAGSWLGRRLGAGVEGDGPVVAVGAERGDGVELDSGAVYVIDLRIFDD
jgi:hypothetical protein